MSFFKLNRKPFEICPDPHFFVSIAAHDEALAGLRYGIMAHKGFMVLTGEVGTGKTLVVRRLLDMLDWQKVPYAYVFCSQLSGWEFLSTIAVDLGFSCQASSKSDLLRQFQTFLLSRGQQGLYTTIIIDEAQNLSPEILEEIRLLTNLETTQGKLLQIVLVGQPELEARIESHAMRPLKQRISLRFHLQPLTELQTRGYIWDRIHRAGSHDPIFTLSAIHHVFIYSKGIPRLINIICDNAMISTFALGVEKVPDVVIDEVAKDLHLSENETDRVAIPTSNSGCGEPDCAVGWAELSASLKEESYH